MGAVKTLLPAETDPALDMLRCEPDPLAQALRPHLDDAEHKLRLLRGQWEGCMRSEQVHGVPGKSELELAWLHACNLCAALRRAVHEHEVDEERDQALGAAPWGQW